MSLMNIAVDFDTGRILAAKAVNIEATMPEAAWKNQLRLVVWPVRPKIGGGFKTQLEQIDVTDYSLQVFVTKLDYTLLANQIAWTKDEVNNNFTGVLSLATAAMTTAFAANPAQISALIEFRLIGDGEPRSVIRPFTIKRPLWVGEDPPDAEDETPEWVVDALALILDDSDTVDVQQDGNSFTFHVRRKTGGRIGAGPDGLFFEEMEPAPDDFIAQLRLESPYSVSPTATNSSDDVSVVAGGVADTWYEAQFRIRGTVELRTYTGGSAIGRFYSGADAIATIEAGLVLKNRNWWKLTISDPAQEHYLNYDVTHGGAAALDYLTPKLRIKAGATITLAYDTLDGLQLPTEEHEDPPASVDPTDPAGSPFIQVDMATEIPAEEVAGDETVYEEVDIEEAGTTEVEMGFPHRVKSLDLNVTVEPYPDAFTRNVVLLVDDDLHDGDLMLVSLFMPASTAPTINLRNETVGGTIIFAWAGDVVARTLEIKCRFNGTAWEVRGWYEVGAEPSDNQLDQSTIASAVIDMDGTPYQNLLIAVNFTLSTINRAVEGKVKEVAALITNTDDEPIAVTYETGIKKPSNAVTTIAAGASTWFSVTSKGPTEAETHVATLVVS